MLRNQAYAFTVSLRGAYGIVQAEGELDIASVAGVRRAVEVARVRYARVVVDLREVSFMDTFALRTLVVLQRDTPPGGSLHVVSGEGIQRVLDVAGGRAALRWISAEQLAA